MNPTEKLQEAAKEYAEAQYKGAHPFVKRQLANDLKKLLVDFVATSPAAREYWEGQGWISVEERLPDEGGRYWCYCESVGELGKSHFQWNCAYDQVEKKFHDFAYSFKDGERVTHWRPLPSPPTSK